MSNNRFKDFDQFWAEKQQQPIQAKVFGEVVSLPASLPAGVMLFAIRSREAGSDTVPPEAVLRMAESVFGKDLLERWVAKGMTVDQLGDVLKWVVAQYNGDADQTADSEQNQGN